MDRGGGTDDYLAGLPGDVAGRVRAANAPGLTALRAYLASGDAVAFLGAGVSAPLYPMWTPLIRELVEVAVTRGLSDDAARTCRARAATQPDAVVEILRRQLGVAGFRAVLREVFRVRRDPTSGRTWTPIHELVCRMPFAGIVTTNYDPGIVDARIRVRSDVASTGFSSWTDELGLGDWITGDALTRDELPVLYAHSWIEGLLDWARARLGVRIDSRGAVPIRPADAVMALLRACPVVLVLDGLEVVQEGPAGNEFGRLLDGALRELLIGACRAEHAGLVVLTSRFPFADLEQFDGRASGMLELSPLTPAEGSAVLARSGAAWLPEQQRQELVGAVDGHALAVSALGGVLADRVGVDVAALHEELLTAGRTDARVARVLQFYADQLAEPDRLLVAAVGLFARPVSPETVLTVASHEVELAALDAHARLDQVEQRHEWADHAAALRARLVPADLDPDPLATVERLVAADQASNDT